MAKINYKQLLDTALKSVVKEALIHAQFNGLGDDASFFITFKTRDPGVVLPDFLRIRYPDLMTIVLQYNNLNVSDKEFGVQLTFDGRPFFIRVPFSALIEFKDPSVDFILSFQPNQPSNTVVKEENIELPLEEKPGTVPDDKRVVSLDEFRNRRKH